MLIRSIPANDEFVLVSRDQLERPQADLGTVVTLSKPHTFANETSLSVGVQHGRQCVAFGDEPN